MTDDDDARWFFGDLAAWAHLQALVRHARRRGPVVPVVELRRIAYPSADPLGFAEHGAQWIRELIDVTQRAGVGRLEQSGNGAAMLRLAEPLPDDDKLYELWSQATSA